MVELKPNIYTGFHCPECQSKQVEVANPFFEGTHTLAECSCGNCGFHFYHDFPVGNAKDQPSAIGIGNGKFYRMKDTEEEQWLPTHFERDAQAVSDADLPIRKIVHKTCREIILLNTLDSCYGHVMPRLVNAHHHLTQESDKGLVLIIPRAFEWMVPDGCAEVWILDVGLGQFDQWLNGFNRFVQEELKRFDKVYLSPAFTNQDWKNIQPEQFTGVKPFDLANFATAPKTFTFITREDRLWFPLPIFDFLWRVAKKLRILSHVLPLFMGIQNRRIVRTFKRIRRDIPDARFLAIGVGKTGSFPDFVEDLRVDRPDARTEREWCERYAESHVVMGVHGSNMLLPSWHAAGAIEMLPDDRFGNIVQDIAVRHYDRRMLFFYRFFPQYINPVYVARIAASIVENYEAFELNMCINTFKSSPE